MLLLQPSLAAPVVQNAKIVPSASDSSKYIALFKIINSGDADALMSVTSKIAGNVTIYSPESVNALPIPAGNSPALSLDGAYIILSDIEGEMKDGNHVPLVLKFEKSGEVFAKAIYHSAKKAMDHSTMDHSKMNHANEKLAPSLSISVEQSPGSKNWQVKANVTNFEFSKEQVDQHHVQGIGHGHLYVDGIKIKRFYQQNTGFGELLPGKHIVRVTLNTNDHHAYSDGDDTVTAVTEIMAY